MTSQKLRGFSDELPDTASQMHKYFLQGTAACLSLCYTNHQHSFIHNEPQETVNLSSVRFGVVSKTVRNVKPGTIELTTAFITS